MRRHPFEKVQLVSTHTQRCQNFDIELRERFWEMLPKKKVELRPPSQDAEHDLMGECGIGGQQVPCPAVKQIGSIAAPLHQQEDVKSQSTR